jgi:hypothetical protein
MVKMNNHSEPEDLQISKLNEFFLVADRIRKAGRSTRQGFGKFKSKPNPSGGDARFAVSISSGNSPFADGSLTLITSSVQSSRETPPAQSNFLSGNLLSKEWKKEIQASEVLAVPSNPARCQALERIAQAISERSDGGAHEGNRQQSPPKRILSDISDQASSGVDEAAGRFPPPQVSSSQSLFPPRFSESFSAYAGQGLEQKIRGAIAARPTKRDEALADRSKDPSEKSSKRTPRKDLSTSTTTPPTNPTLIVHSSSGLGRTSPVGEETQGPSLVDYIIELKADFAKDLVIEMQGNAARKARRTVIGRMMGGRASFKALQECLKLHLPATFVSVTLLTRGFFLIFFEDEEGATSTRKLATVEWEWTQPILLQVQLELRCQRTRSGSSLNAYRQGSVPGSARTVQKRTSSHHHGEQAKRSARD